MRISVFIVFMTMTMGVYAQKYKVGTTTALWKVRLSLKPWGIALKFLFLHHENILFPND